MGEYLLLRLDAPLMSFGGVLVDENGVTERWPGLSLLTGLLGNALGYHHRQAELLQRLQARVRFAVRRDRDGARLEDFHTVDLGQPMFEAGWTTRGAIEGRQGGSAATGTHIRHRHYYADAVYSIALTLDPAEEAPSLARLAEALERPERPLFIGRKTCLPAAPLLTGRCEAPTLLDALARAPRLGAPREVEAEALPACWPADDPGPEGLDRRVPDLRDWTNQVHTGERIVREGSVVLREVIDG